MLELLREHGIGDKIEKDVSETEEIMQKDSHIDRHLIYGKGNAQIFTTICSELIEYICEKKKLDLCNISQIRY